MPGPGSTGRFPDKNWRDCRADSAKWGETPTIRRQPMTERDVFLQALEIDNPTKRAAFVEQACANQPELRRSVEQLLQAHDLAGQFLNDPHPAAGAPERTGAYVADPPAELAGTVIAGKYKLLQRIGEGGMGSVWMADQLEPVKRRVAGKLIRAE